MNHVHKKHTDNPAAAAQNVTMASQPASSVQNMTKAPQPDAPAQNLTPAQIVTTAPKPAKCTICATRCTDSEVLKKHMTRVHKVSTVKNVTPVKNKNVWKVTPNLSTKDIDNLLEDEEEIREEVERLEHDIGINQSAAQWQGVNFGSTFGTSGEFDGRIASTLTQVNKCEDCEVNSKTIDNQRQLLTKLDKQLHDSHKYQREEKKEKLFMKKKLDEAVKLVQDITTENTNMKQDLQVQKDLVVALKMKFNEENEGPRQDSLPDSQQQCDQCNFVSKDRVLMTYHKEHHHKDRTNEEGPLPEKERKCRMCNFTTKNRVLSEEHKQSHIKLTLFKCEQCRYTSANREDVKLHEVKHKKEQEMYCNMCNYTSKNKEVLLEHKESHKNTKLLKCDMCNFTVKDQRLMKDHKESHKEQSDFKCLMCSSIFPNIESFKKHKRKHHQELNVGKSVDYPMNVYSFKCTPCQISFKNHEDLMEHMCSLHITREQLTKNQREGHGLAKYNDSNSGIYQDSRPPLCTNGDSCRFHSQHRCNFSHPKPPQAMQFQPRRQAPSTEWKQVHYRRPHHNQEHKVQETHKQQPQGQSTRGPVRNTSETWCKHPDNCLQGRFCALREDFRRRPSLRRQ